MKYSLYINPYCFACEDIMAYIDSNDLNVNIIDISKTSINSKLPIVVFPALVLNEKLLAYGSDIIKYLKINT